MMDDARDNTPTLTPDAGVATRQAAAPGHDAHTAPAAAQRGPHGPATTPQADTTTDAAHVAAAAAPGCAPVAAPERGPRAGADARRRGWFWHWNSIVTQYAPLVGLKGIGLLNSYTVWTDRRDESPHRGYAFPSQQAEADFYGEERAELIT